MMGCADGTRTVAGFDIDECPAKEWEVADMGRAVDAMVLESSRRFSMNSSATAPIWVLNVCRASMRSWKKAVSEWRGITTSF